MLVPSALPLLNRHLRLGHACVVDHSKLSVINTRLMGERKRRRRNTLKKKKKKRERERGKYQCHIAASCTYRVPTIISLLLKTIRTMQRSLYLNEQIWRFAGKMSVSRKNGPLAEKRRQQQQQTTTTTTTTKG